MEKFTLYDLLGLFLPGVLFIFFCNVLNNLYNVCPALLTSGGSDIGIGILLCFALVTGAMLYSVNFYLEKKAGWYRWLFGMKKKVADLFLEMTSLHQLMNTTLNRKAVEWYGKEIYFSKDRFNALPETDQEQAKDTQDEYYDRMYYELEYMNKIDTPKTFQSFYYFFRQLVTASMVLLVMLVILQVASLIPCSGLIQPELNIPIWLAICFLITLILSAGNARWYRKSMIAKMYWAYFTHLNQPLNK